MGDVDTQAAGAAEDTAGGGVQVKKVQEEEVQDPFIKTNALEKEEALSQCKEESSGCKDPPGGGVVTGSGDNTEGTIVNTSADNNTGGNDKGEDVDRETSLGDSVPRSSSNEINSPPPPVVREGGCATGVSERKSDEQPEPEPISSAEGCSHVQESISEDAEQLTAALVETNMEVISSMSSPAPGEEQLHSGDSGEGATNPGTDGTGGQGDIGTVTENAVGQGLGTELEGNNETAANSGISPRLASPSDTRLSLASAEGGDTGEIRELPVADTSVDDSAHTDKSSHSEPPEVGAGQNSVVGVVEESDNHIPINTDDKAIVSPSATSNLEQNDPENRSNEAVQNKPTEIGVLPVANEDLSETVSSMSFSALTSPSEGSVTLDSPSVSSTEDLAPGMREAHIEGNPSSDNGANCNGANTDDDNQMVVIPSTPMLINGQDSARSASEESQSAGLGASDLSAGVVSSPDADKPREKDHKVTQEDPTTHKQDIPYIKPDLDMPQSSTSAHTAAGTNSIIETNAAIPDCGSDSTAVSEGRKDPKDDTHDTAVVCTKTEDTNDATSVPKEDIRPECDQNTASAGTTLVSLSVAPPGATSPDSSFASSGGPTGLTLERAIDPYSVALDDALGSSSFNTSFVSTDISTDPEHTDAESVCTEGDSPRDPDAALVSTLQLKDIKASASSKPMAEESKVVSKSLPSGGDAAPVPSGEDVKRTESENKNMVGDQTPEVAEAIAKSAGPPENVPPKDDMESSLDNQPLKVEVCPVDASGGSSHHKVTKETTDADTQLASGQLSANGEAKKEDVGAGPEASDIERGTTQGVVGEMPPGGSTGTPTGVVGTQEDQSVGQTCTTRDSPGTDTITGDVNTTSKSSDSSMGNSCQKPSPKNASPSSPSHQDDSGHRPASPEAGDRQTVESSPLKSPERKLHSLQEATEMMLALGCAESELVAPPEVVVTEAPPSGKDDDAPDGSRLTQGEGKTDMAPPGRSVVMRKKPTVRLAPQPATKDVQLQQKIDHEIKMRDGTAKLLAASKHPSQLLEAAKNLLTSNARMIAYMSELQRRKTDEVLNRHRKAESVKTPCKAKVALSDIRIPLMWRDSDHFKNKGDHRRFAVFCVLKIGTQIYDTTLLKDVDSSMTDLTFDDVIIFENMDPDFECQLEVYCHRVCDDHTVGSTPRRLKKKFNEISTSVGRSVGRRLSGLKDDPEFMANMIVGPRFEMIASATLTLADVRDSISIFDLPANCSASTEGGSTELPLFGNFCCRLAAQPRCMMVEVAAGYMQVKAGSEPWRKQWCMLGRQNLHTWSSERDQKEGQEPILDITITSDARVKDVEEKSETGHVVQLTAWSNGRRRTFQLALESAADRDVWSSSLQQHITDIGAWKQACDKVMDIEQTTPPNRRSTFAQHPRSSLYEETPWNDDDSPMTRMLNRLDMEEQQRDSLKPV